MNRTPAPTDTASTDASGGSRWEESGGSRWEELVTAALLGTARRTPSGIPAGREAPTALLDAAAVETVRR
ncbi:hypothetical protein O3Q52_51300, partial [Streptomyces sp. ActVer]|nr:hypothetical protein [Streptomyces sp. ActVer]